MINGRTLRDAIISGANAIENNRQRVDELNVFPVPDGDTGTNMSLTMSMARKEMMEMPDDADVGTVAAKAASALLRGARGNSGVITSLLFRGFSKGLKGLTEAGGGDLASALTLGVEAAYKAVMKPTEGTILTVARVAAERARAAVLANNKDLYIWDEICIAAEEALETTPELLPVLKRAGVVDAGGQGICIIFRGMQQVFREGVIVELSAGGEETVGVDNFSDVVAKFDDSANFAYSVEMEIEKKDDASAEIKKYLESVGDCVVVVDDEKVVKAFAHTDVPGEVITKAVSFGKVLSSKIAFIGKAEEETAVKKFERVDPVEGEIGFVAVAAGDGLTGLFTDLGCQNVVSGGQTMNPSTDDILAAVQATPAQTVFVLPNNKNIIMAAEQAVAIADRKMIVVPTRTIPQGLAAMLAYDPDGSIEDNSEGMVEAARRVSCGQVTFAARDSEFDGHKITEGDILGLQNGKLTFTEKDPVKAIVKVAKAMMTKDTEFMTLIYGEGITEEQAETARTLIEARAKKTSRSVEEVTLINGGQPVYYFILSVE